MYLRWGWGWIHTPILRQQRDARQVDWGRCLPRAQKSQKVRGRATYFLAGNAHEPVTGPDFKLDFVFICLRSSMCTALHRPFHFSPTGAVTVILMLYIAWVQTVI